MARQRPNDDDDDDIDERPRRRSRNDDDDFDDDDAPRARRRTRRDEEDDYDDEPRPKKKRLPRAKLRKIAILQKVLLLCALAYVLCVIAAVFVPLELRWIIGIPGSIVVLTGAVLVLLISIETDAVGLGILFALLAIVPCLGLIIVVVINQRTIGILSRHGIPVGFMGASLSDI